MVGEDVSARLTLTITAINPRDDSISDHWEIGFEQNQINRLLRKDGKVNDGTRLKRIYLVEQVVKNPSVVFQDLKRINHELGSVIVVDHLKITVEWA